jgi:hypothetical protein
MITSFRSNAYIPLSRNSSIDPLIARLYRHHTFSPLTKPFYRFPTPCPQDSIVIITNLTLTLILICLGINSPLLQLPHQTKYNFVANKLACPGPGPVNPTICLGSSHCQQTKPLARSELTSGEDLLPHPQTSTIRVMFEPFESPLHADTTPAEETRC